MPKSGELVDYLSQSTTFPHSRGLPPVHNRRSLLFTSLASPQKALSLLPSMPVLMADVFLRHALAADEIIVDNATVTVCIIRSVFGMVGLLVGEGRRART